VNSGEAFQEMTPEREARRCALRFRFGNPEGRIAERSDGSSGESLTLAFWWRDLTCSQTKKPAEKGGLILVALEELVAGIGFEPMTFRL
jgi:hypothetical protein